MKALFILLGLSFGLYIGFYLTPLFTAILVLETLLFVFLAIKKKKLKYFLISFCIGTLLSFSSYLPLLNQNKCLVLICQSRKNYAIGRTLFHKFYIYDSSNFEVGDIVKIQGNLSLVSFTEYESKFSFSSYLKGLGITKEFKVDSFSYLIKNPIRFRTIENTFLSFFPNKERSLIQLILFNKKDYENELINKLVLYLYCIC